MRNENHPPGDGNAGTGMNECYTPDRTTPPRRVKPRPALRITKANLDAAKNQSPVAEAMAGDKTFRVRTEPSRCVRVLAAANPLARRTAKEHPQLDELGTRKGLFEIPALCERGAALLEETASGPALGASRVVEQNQGIVLRRKSGSGTKRSRRS